MSDYRIIEVPQQNIAVVSLSPGAGSTFHAMNLASFFSDYCRVGLYDSPYIRTGRTYLKDFFQKEDFSLVSVPHYILNNQEVDRDRLLTYKDMFIYTVDYESKQKLDFTKSMLLQYIHTGKHTIKIFDFGYFDFLSFDLQILQSFDHIILVVQPTPFHWLPNLERLHTFLNYQKKLSIQFLINPMPGDMSLKEVNEILNITYSFPSLAFDYEKVLHSFNEGVTFYDLDSEGREALQHLYQTLASHLDIPLISDRKRKKDFSKWKNLFLKS